MLKGKQKRQLRSLAHHLSPIFQVGKSGVTSEMIQGIRDALEKRELIKVNKNHREKFLGGLFYDMFILLYAKFDFYQ